MTLNYTKEIRVLRFRYSRSLERAVLESKTKIGVNPVYFRDNKATTILKSS